MILRPPRSRNSSPTTARRRVGRRTSSSEYWGLRGQWRYRAAFSLRFCEMRYDHDRARVGSVVNRLPDRDLDFLDDRNRPCRHRSDPLFGQSAIAPRGRDAGSGNNRRQVLSVTLSSWLASCCRRGFPIKITSQVRALARDLRRPSMLIYYWSRHVEAPIARARQVLRESRRGPRRTRTLPVLYQRHA